MLKSTRVLVLDNFRSCVLVLEACVLDSSTDLRHIPSNQKVNYLYILWPNIKS